MSDESILIIPDGTENIDKKEYLNNKNVRRIVLPDSVREVGDWAFAYCNNLKEVEFSENVHFGKEVFKGCEKLKHLNIRGKEEGIGALLSAICEEAPYLMDPKEAGSKEWIDKWDARLLTILRASDDEGYSKQIMCGEEDYASTNLEGYKRAARKRKSRLVLLRLLYPVGLNEEIKKELTDYALDHTKGSPEGEETWEVVLKEFGQEREYYELFASLGCVNAVNLNDILKDIKGEHTEMKAYFIRFMDEEREEKKSDFFDSLKL